MALLSTEDSNNSQKRMSAVLTIHPTLAYPFFSLIRPLFFRFLPKGGRICEGLLYCIFIWLSYHPFSTVSVLDGRSILVNMIDIKLSKFLLTTVMGLSPFSMHSVALVNPKALPLTG